MSGAYDREEAAHTNRLACDSILGPSVLAGFLGQVCRGGSRCVDEKLTMRRVNISNANVFGLSKDLGLEGIQYNISLVIFFVPVSVFASLPLTEMC
jgi:hypothetical protein